jgi:5-oxoprolinase (ATP-hydrolysing) subunit A
MTPDDINCAMGTGEPRVVTRALARSVTSVNIACGAHAGSLQDMEYCVAVAAENNLRIGALPGRPLRAARGRMPHPIRPAELAELIVLQCAALEKVAHRANTTLHHVKLHGALYDTVDRRVCDARAAAEAIRSYFPRLVVFAFAGGKFHREAASLGIEVWPEAFVDRAYLDGGRLVPKAEPGASITDARAVADRVRHLVRFGEILSIHGRPVPVAARTLCVDAELPAAAAIAREARRLLPCGDGELATGAVRLQ